MKQIVTAGALLLLSGSVLAASVDAATTTQTDTKAQVQSSTAADANHVLKTDQDKLSYALGASLGKAAKEKSLNLQPEVVAQGLRDGLQGNKTLMTEAEMKKELTNAAAGG